MSAVRVLVGLVGMMTLGGAEGLLGQTAGPQGRLTPSAVEVSDSLLYAGEIRRAYEVLDARLEFEPADFAAAWRAVRAALGLGILGEDHETRLAWLRLADERGRRLLDHHPEEVEALAWAAAARGRRALAEDGSRTLARLADEVIELTDRALEKDPDHPLANHVRGKINQEGMRLPGMVRFMGRLLLGAEVLSRTSWEEAEARGRTAVEQAPGMLLFHLELAETYRYQEKWAAAEAAYRDGLARPDSLPVDVEFRRIMEERLAEVQAERDEDP